MKNPALTERLKLMQHFGARYGLDASSLLGVEDMIRRYWYREMSGAEVQNLCQEAAMKLIRSKILASENRTTELESR